MNAHRLPGAALLAATLLISTSPAPLGAANAPPAPSAIEFVMPADGAFIAGGPVVVAGRLPPGDSFVNLLLDDAPVGEIVREGRTFQATLNPGPGPHALEARAGDLSARLSFTFGTGGRGASPYRYHKPVLEGRCAECHAGVRQGGAGAEGQTCKSCHRKLAVIFPYVHGPLAAGKCVVCHEPHGSSWPALTIGEPRAMCTACHDQLSSREHIDKARTRVCYLCHNPHASMNRRLLYDIVK
jgi:predicted CXXCH cytochrome family protein